MPYYGYRNASVFALVFCSTVILSTVFSAKLVPNFANVLIKNGSVRGEVISVNGFGCNVFLGIPYARPPLRDLRFRRPTQHHGWPGVLIANNYRSACMQPTGNDHLLNSGAPISEDCLYLNIFAPSRKPITGGAYSVFLWVHGGGFVYGTAATIHPNDVCRRIASQGVVVVTINYRLGPFGFLDTLDGKLTPNLGLHDILQALRWVDENIEEFGGDNTQITVGGHGSGAACVSALTLDNYATISDFISRVILMSGSILAPWAVTNHSASSTEKLAKSLGCSSSFSVVQCLRNQSAGKVAAAADPLWSLSGNHVGRLLVSTPKSILAAGKHKNLPILLGLSKDEAAFLVFQKLSNISKTLSHDSFFDRLLPEFVADFLKANNHPLAEVLKYQYFNWHPNGNLHDYLETSIQLYTDFLYRAPILQEAFFRSQLPDSNIMLYSFSEKATVFLGKNTAWKGTPHGLDLLHLWGPNSVQPHRGFFQISPSSSHSPISQLWSRFITNRTNLPSTVLGLVRWISFSESHPFVLEIGPKLRMVPANLEQSMKFWTEFLPHLLDMIRKNITTSSTTLRYETFTTTRPTTAVSTSSTSTKITSKTHITTVPVSSVSTKPPETQVPYPPTKEHNSEEAGVNRTVLWLMVSLALIFFLLCLFTAGACAAWNRQSYHPRGPNRRSRHQNAQVRRPQPVLSPPIPPRPPHIAVSNGHCRS